MVVFLVLSCLHLPIATLLHVPSTAKFLLGLLTVPVLNLATVAQRLDRDQLLLTLLTVVHHVLLFLHRLFAIPSSVLKTARFLDGLVSVLAQRVVALAPKSRLVLL